MQKTKSELPEIKLIGITTRTNNEEIFKALPSENPIANTVQKYFTNNLAEQIPNRAKPGTTYCVYTEFESDFSGDYTYFVGEAVSSFENLPEGFLKLTIPAQNYMKFTNGPAPMPDVCVDTWKEIWQTTTEGFGGEKSYIADFEVYDERAADHNNVVLDIYIGVKEKKT